MQANTKLNACKNRKQPSVKCVHSNAEIKLCNDMLHYCKLINVNGGTVFYNK